MASEVPWWSNLVSILGTAIVSVLGTVYFMKGAQAPAVKGPPGIGTLIKETIMYLPHIMLMFGVLADMFTMEGVYSIPSLVGVLSMPASFVMKYFWAGIASTIGYIVELIAMGKKSATGTSVAEAIAAPAAAVAATATGTAARPKAAVADVLKGGALSDYDGCTVQGFSGVQSPYSPQTLVVTATIFWYYIIDLIVNKGIANAATSLGIFVVLFTTEFFVIGDCPSPDGTKISRWFKGIISMAEGALFGGTAYAVMQAYYPSQLPSAVLSPVPRVSIEKLVTTSDGSLYDPKTGYSYTLVNGQPVLNTSKTTDGGAGPGPGGKNPAIPTPEASCPK